MKKFSSNRFEDDGREWRGLLQFRPILSEEELKRQLENDKALINDKDPVVKRLIQLRGHVVAHINEELILGQPKIQNWPTWDVFNQLLERGLGIVNYYKTFYDGDRTHPQDSWNEESCRLIFKRLRIASLALDFVNLKIGTLDPEDSVDTIHQFVKEVREEIYKQ